MHRPAKNLRVLLGIFLIIALGYLAVTRTASYFLKKRLAAALDHAVTIRRIDLHLDRLRFVDVSYQPPDPFAPARGSVEVILIRPRILPLFSGRMDIASLQLVRPSLRLRLAKPTEARPSEKGRDRKSVGVPLRRVEIEDGSIDLVDPGARDAVFHLRKAALRINGLMIPSWGAPDRFTVDARLIGRNPGGRLTAEGSSNTAAKTMKATFKLKDADLTLFEPYYRKFTSAEIESGTVGLDLTIRIENGLIEAPGVLHLDDLQFRSSGNPLANFMGIPITLLSPLLKDNNGRIDLEFTIRGRADDPDFSFAQQFLRKIAVSLARKTGRTLSDTGGSILEPAKKGLEELGEGLNKTLKGWTGR